MICIRFSTDCKGQGWKQGDQLGGSPIFQVRDDGGLDDSGSS